MKGEKHHIEEALPRFSLNRRIGVLVLLASMVVVGVVVLGCIVAVGGAVGSAPLEIDVAGQVLAPGFVDVHTHDDGALLRYPGRGNFMVWRFIPVGAEETIEEFDFFYESATPSEMERDAIRYIDTVLQPEDINLVESVQRGMRTPAFTRSRYMVDPQGTGMSEHAVHHFHGLLLDAYAKVAG